MFDLTGQVAVITGSSRGIGGATAECMARAGAKVVVSSRKPAACQAVADAIAASGGEALVVPCNVAEKEQLQNLIDQTVARFGRLDILVCNAAVNPYFGPMAKMPDEAYDKIMHSNVRSNFWLCNMAAPHMVASGGGSIIIISSIGGRQGSPTLAVYGMSKSEANPCWCARSAYRRQCSSVCFAVRNGTRCDRGAWLPRFSTR